MSCALCAMRSRYLPAIGDGNKKPRRAGGSIRVGLSGGEKDPMREHEVRSSGRGAGDSPNSGRSALLLFSLRLVRCCYHEPSYLWPHFVLFVDCVDQRILSPTGGTDKRKDRPIGRSLSHFLVEETGLEPVTSCLQSRRSSS